MAIPHLAATPGAGAGLGVTLGELTFNGQPDEFGAEFYLSRIEGWDSPNLRDDLDDRSLAHGAYRGQSFYGVRELSLSGVVLSRGSLGVLRQAKDRLAYESDLTDTDAVLVVHESPAKQVRVRRSGRLRLAQTGQHLLRWELDLTAADPRKYAVHERTVTLTDGQTLDAPNAGTFRSGTPLRARFSNAGTLIVGQQSLAVTGQAEVDTLDGTVLNNGQTVFSRLVSRGALPLLPARSTTPLSYSGAGQVVVTWRDAWV